MVNGFTGAAEPSDGSSPDIHVYKDVHIAMGTENERERERRRRREREGDYITTTEPPLGCEWLEEGA